MEPCMCVGLCFYLSASSRLSQIPCIYFCACSCIFLSLLYKEIPWRLEERIVIEPPFSPAETVSLSFCLPPQPFVREKKKSLPLEGSAQIVLWLPGKWGGFQRGRPAGARQARASPVWEPLAVSEFAGCQKPGASWSEGSPRQGRGAQECLALRQCP